MEFHLHFHFQPGYDQPSALLWRSFMHRRLVRTLGVFMVAPLLYSAACSDGGTGTTGTGGATGTTGVTGTGGTTDATGTGGTTGVTTSTGVGGATSMLDEKVLDVQLTLAGTTLTITVKDAGTPVMTDAWLYTLKAGVMTPLTGFQDPDSKRKYRGLLLPCTLAKAPSGLAPCDNGELNGIMTDAVRDTLANGANKSAIDGTVKVTLDAAPTDTIVVVVAREDERYAGAAGIDPNGQAATLPVGVGAPESHVAVTYTKDVQPLIKSLCTSCHTKGLIAGDYPLDTYDNVVNFDFGHKESVEACEAKTPGNQAAIDACIAAITKTEYMIELGNPALSTLIRRARPDEEKSASLIGSAWWGTKTGARFDDHGDRRMPSLNTTADTADDVAGATHFDDKPADFKVLWDWIAQGAVK
jgi:hypothetical protein